MKKDFDQVPGCTYFGSASNLNLLGNGRLNIGKLLKSEKENKKSIINTQVEILVVIRNNCKECDDLINNLQLLKKVKNNIELVTYNLSKANESESHSEIPMKVIITPALFINGRLKHYGNVSFNKLKKLIFNYSTI